MKESAQAAAGMISISIVSHSQIDLIVHLLQDIEEHCQDSSLEVILTLNLNETLPPDLESHSFPIKLIRNATPKGFAANHNQAFTHAAGAFFCVMNPDIRMSRNPFPALLACLKDQSLGLVAPLVLDARGEIEDSARRFPSPARILCRVFGGCRGSDYAIKDTPIHPDWVGGMFMLFPRGIYEMLGGFDQRFFLYYEDVDLCGRLRLQGEEVALCPRASVVHYARRSSHRKVRYLLWHFKSMMRFFCSSVYWQLRCKNGAK